MSLQLSYSMAKSWIAHRDICNTHLCSEAIPPLQPARVIRACLSPAESQAIVLHPAHPTAPAQSPEAEAPRHPPCASSLGTARKAQPAHPLPVGLLWWGLLSGKHADNTQLLQARVESRDFETILAPLLLQSAADSLSSKFSFLLSC